MPILRSEMDANRAALAKLMQQEPRRQPERITTADAIAEFAPEIRALLKAGHSLADIAACLTLGGCPVSVQQLQRYLKGATARAATKKKIQTAKVATASARKGTTGAGLQEKPTDVPSESITVQPGLSPTGGLAPVTAAPIDSGPADQTRVTAAASSALTGSTLGSIASTEAATQAATAVAEANSAQAKPQSTASPTTDDPTVAEARNRSVDKLLAMAAPSTKANLPHEPNIAWRGMGITLARDDAPTQSQPELGKLL